MHIPKFNLRHLINKIIKKKESPSKRTETVQKKEKTDTIYIADLDDTLTKTTSNLVYDIPIRRAYFDRKLKKPNAKGLFWTNADGKYATNNHCQALRMRPQFLYQHASNTLQECTPPSETQNHSILALVGCEEPYDDKNQCKPNAQPMFQTLCLLQEKGLVDLANTKKIVFIDDLNNNRRALMNLQGLIQKKLGFNIPCKFMKVKCEDGLIAQDIPEGKTIHSQDLLLETSKIPKYGSYTISYHSKNTKIPQIMTYQT